MEAREEVRVFRMLKVLRESNSQNYGGLRNEIIEMNIPLLQWNVRKFANKRFPFDDLLGVASVALVRSVDGFNVSLGNRFSTYATRAIRTEISRHIAKELRIASQYATNKEAQDTQEDRSVDHQSSVETKEFAESLLKNLTIIECFVVVRFFGLCGYDKMILSEIGEKLGRSKERMSQIKRGAVEKLQKLVNEKGDCYDAS